MSLSRWAILCSYRLSWSHTRRAHAYSFDFQCHPAHRASIILRFPSFAVVFSIWWNMYIFKYIVTLLLFQVFLKLILEEHIALDSRFIEIFVISSNRVVGKMYEFVADLFCIVVDGWESEVALIIHPDGRRVEVCNEHPLTDIKFSLEDNERVFYVFLCDP